MVAEVVATVSADRDGTFAASGRYVDVTSSVLGHLDRFRDAYPGLSPDGLLRLLADDVDGCRCSTVHLTP